MPFSPGQSSPSPTAFAYKNRLPFGRGVLTLSPCHRAIITRLTRTVRVCATSAGASPRAFGTSPTRLVAKNTPSHYKQTFASVPLVAVLSVVRPQCGRTSPKEAPRSTASKVCSPLVCRSGEQLRTVQGIALFLFYCFVVCGVKSGSGYALGLYLLRCRKSPPRSIAT